MSYSTIAQLFVEYEQEHSHCPCTRLINAKSVCLPYSTGLWGTRKNTGSYLFIRHLLLFVLLFCCLSNHVADNNQVGRVKHSRTTGSTIEYAANVVHITTED